jgi:hypothetical protein
MKGNRAVLALVLAVVLLGAGWCAFTRSNDAASIDLVQQFETATKSPAGGTFELLDAELNGETRKAIYAPPPTRITWKLHVPDRAWLNVAMGMKPEAWSEEGNGVLFLVGVSDGRRFDELFRQHVNPFGNNGDRRWIPVWVDLSAYAGEEIELIFNTRSGPPEQGDDARNDHALWGAPEIVVR